MSQSKMGATILYCGHDASFVGDIYRIGTANVIVANGPISAEGVLQRPANDCCTHHIMDSPEPTYWSTARGIFVVPEAQCVELKPGDLARRMGRPDPRRKTRKK